MCPGPLAVCGAQSAGRLQRQVVLPEVHQANPVTVGAMKRAFPVWLAVLAVLAAAPGCSRSADEAVPAIAFADGLRQRVATDAMLGHLAKLQQIADANGGNRAVGRPGYDASVAYVTQVLRDKGFDVQTPEFEVRVFSAEKPVLTVADQRIEANVLKYSLGTPPEGIGGPLVAAPAGESPGCVPADYDGRPVRGAVVLVDRGSCPFHVKQTVAATLGALALVVADNVDEEVMPGTLGENTEVKIPVVSVSKDDGARLRANLADRSVPAMVRLDATTTTVKARNVIAQTKTGSTSDVVLVGAHLDSVPEGPGINDNGSGVAAVLETAVALGSSPDVRHAVRFAFWGAEELGTVGSNRYLQSLDIEALKDIALYLNFDMIASPNAGYFTYDGDQSTAPQAGQPPPRVPEGSPGIERTLVEYLKSAGKTARDTSFDGRSDYDGFTRAGIPAGGLFAGAEEKMTAEQAQLWGGTADAPFDPDYHKDTDTLARINREALGIQGGGVAYSVGAYAQDLGGRNGMPERADRTRHLVTAS